jgi:hypothetical protein
LRAYTYPALHRSFVHRVFSFVSFMASSFWIGLKVRSVDLVWGTSPPIFQGVTARAGPLEARPVLIRVRDLWPASAIQACCKPAGAADMAGAFTGALTADGTHPSPT